MYTKLSEMYTKNILTYTLFFKTYLKTYTTRGGNENDKTRWIYWTWNYGKTDGAQFIKSRF
ncbi:hypothetical protein PMEGAPL103_17570 [Priestia megaterium]